MGGIDDTSITGLIHLGGREYDSEVGRFLSADPLLNLTKPKSLNGYSYAENNAVTFSDPTGQASTCSSNCGGELLFKESHAAPDFNTGETWEESTRGKHLIMTTTQKMGCIAAGSATSSLMQLSVAR
ncbi:RHS repeat-associated core domain-containing protein [Streptomyces sp. NPDC057509]|uniref:RHS repeat-associated core domain-containing protein n=1 Tax=Streptomyces sp. NPDC057509 TaxID=3346152 RepID=UPI0036A1B959